VSLRKKWRWVYFLPVLHLCGSIVSYFLAMIPALNFMAFVWQFIMLADLPISLVTMAIGFRYPGMAVVWMFVVGTLWWYLLSRIVEVLFNLFAGGSQPPTIYTSGRLGTGSSVASAKWPAAKRL
jgi:hypothetical protein